MLFGLGAPLAPDARMKDFFERAFFRGVAKYYRAKGGAVQVATSRKNFVAKLLMDCFAHFGKIDKFMRGVVCVEKFGSGQHFAQTPTEGALAGGDSAGDSNCWQNKLT